MQQNRWEQGWLQAGGEKGKKVSHMQEWSSIPWCLIGSKKKINKKWGGLQLHDCSGHPDFLDFPRGCPWMEEDVKQILNIKVIETPTHPQFIYLFNHIFEQ